MNSGKRFLDLDEVSEELNISRAQTYALIRRGELKAIKVGGRGVWRVGRVDVENYLEHAFEETEAWLAEHPYSGPEEQGDHAT